ncbi:ABC transporter permease [Sunxiuqinia sp. A32]|uniref:ABC transporter permease n=1 Tax=Sunxiuqinia sp. A32 TaxID=3461496 RepID=UPI0040461E90
MNFRFLKIFIRNYKKHKVVTTINILGLTIGILSSLFIFEYVFFERSFDDYHEKGSRICRVVYNRYQNEKLQWKTANSFYPTGKWLKENYSEVQDWAVISRKYNITVSYENTVNDKVFYNEEKTYYASNSLFNLFTIPIIKGEQQCLEQPNTVAISQRAAKRYFGKENPIGKVLTVNNSENYTITAVYQTIPANSHLQTDFLFSYSAVITSQNLENNWWNDYLHTYILLAPGVNPDEFCKRAMPELIAKNYLADLENTQSRDEYFLQPVPDIHLNSNIEYETEPPGNAKTMNILFGFAIFLLVIAWINYINLVTALSLDRAREIGIKKINGARKIMLIGQFISEAFLFNSLCLTLTLGMYFLINPIFKSVTNIHDFNLLLQASFIRTGLLVFLSGIIISSIYPAIVLSSYRPVTILKGKFKNSMQGIVFRKGLVTTQFIISIILLIGTIVTFRQASFLQQKEMGIDYNSSLVIRAPQMADNLETRMKKLQLLKSQALQLPEITDCTLSSDVPGQEINNGFGGRRKGFDKNDSKAYFHIAVDDQFMDFYKIKVLAGRKFHKNETTGQNTLLMNKLAMERFGYSNPEDAVGQVFIDWGNREWQVIGVVDDFYYKSVKTEPVPTIITLDDGVKIFLTFKLSNLGSGSFASLVPQLRSYYEAIFPNQPFEYFSLDDRMRMDLKPDKTFASVFTLFSALAILIAVIGIIGLILITISQNKREMGIRKALGAEIADVGRLLSKQLITQFVVAILAAIPLSYYGYKHWFLETYIHRINLDVWFFAVPVLLLLTVIFSVVYLLSVNVFRMRTSDVLKCE